MTNPESPQNTPDSPVPVPQEQPDAPPCPNVRKTIAILMEEPEPDHDVNRWADEGCPNF